MLSRTRILVLSLILAFFPIFARSQGPIVPSSSPAEPVRAYPNSPDGLRMQLQDILAGAKEENRPKLETLVKETEIPNYEKWFTTTFGQERGESWAEPYGSSLAENQRNFEKLIVQIAGEDGEIYTRKVSDNPGPPDGMEANMIRGLHGPVDYFFASWRKPGSSQDSKGDPIGYFVFLDRKFRWDSTIVFTNSQPAEDSGKGISQSGASRQSAVGKVKGPFQPGVDGITFPSCSFCPDPEYPKEAKANAIEGTVTLRVIIQPNGRATDIQIVKSLRADLDQSAVQAVSRWRFNPALGPSGNPVSVIVPVEITFRLLR